MTEQDKNQGDPLSGLLDVFKSHFASLLLHGSIILVVVLLTTFGAKKPAEVIEVEIIESLPVPDPPAIEAPKPTPRPEPASIPDEVPIEKVERTARPYHPRADELNQQIQQPAAPETRRLPQFSPAFAISMDATITGGDGIEVMAVGGDSANVLADPGRPGFYGIQDTSAQDLGQGGFPGVELADSWEITVEPEPINDRAFKPVYPPNARMQRREAVVEVALAIDPAGKVIKTRVLRSGGSEFSESALEYCRKLKFKPARANQVPVASRIVWEVIYCFGAR